MENSQLLQINNKQYLKMVNNQIPEYIQFMVNENPCKLLVKMYQKTKVVMLYDITGLISLKEVLLSSGINFLQVENYRLAIRQVKQIVKEYLIDEELIVFHEEYIYTNREMTEFYFIIAKREDEYNENKLFKYLIGNCFTPNSFSEIRLREEWLRYAKSHPYNDQELTKIAISIKQTQVNKNKEHIKITPPKFKMHIKNLFAPKDKYNSETCEIRSSDVLFSLTNMYDITKKLPITGDELVIGRTQLQKDIHVFNKKIGRSHARLYVDDHEIFLVDLGSKNGTSVNGEILLKRTPISVDRGDIISFADEEFILC